MIEVVMGVLYRSDGKFLIAKRPSHKMYGGLWEFPGGKLQEDEAPEQALIRELDEELEVKISIDKKLDEYVSFFNDDFIGLTGTEEQLKEVSDIFNIFYFKEGVNTDKDYLMSHPTSIYLIDRDGKLILKYPHNTKQEFVVEDLKRLL